MVEVELTWSSVPVEKEKGMEEERLDLGKGPEPRDWD